MKEALVNFILKFVTSFGRQLHPSYGVFEKDGTAVEVPHMAFGLLSAADRFVITPPDSTCPPPQLGLAIPLTDDLARLRKQHRSSPSSIFKLNHTYTIAFYSMYMDFER